MDRANVSASAVESLVHRGVLWNTMLSDCFTEGFIMKTEVFDMGQQMFPKTQLLSLLKNTPPVASDEVPF